MDLVGGGSHPPTTPPPTNDEMTMTKFGRPISAN